MRPILLHTSILHAYLRGDPHVVATLLRKKPTALCLSAITIHELTFAQQVVVKQALSIGVEALIANLAILPFDRPAAVLAGRLQAHAQRDGKIISTLDAQLAGQALAGKLTLATIRPQDLPVPMLQVHDWSQPGTEDASED